jgi:hypothetical protein
MNINPTSDAAITYCARSGAVYVGCTSQRPLQGKSLKKVANTSVRGHSELRFDLLDERLEL